MKVKPWKKPLSELERFFDDEDWTMMIPPKFFSATAIDIYEKDGNLVAEADVAGVKPEDIGVTVEDGVLTIEGESVEEQEEKGRKYYKKERRVGRVYRAIRLPKAVDGKGINAEFEEGKLTVTMPIVQQAKSKKVEVKFKK